MSCSAGTKPGAHLALATSVPPPAARNARKAAAAAARPMIRKSRTRARPGRARDKSYPLRRVRFPYLGERTARAILSRSASGDRGCLRQARERRLHVRLRELGILELAGQVGVVGGQVEVTVAAEV